MAFLVFNVILFVLSAILVYSGFANFKLILTLPTSLQFVLFLGFITPIMNLYDVIKNFVNISSIEDENEDNL